MGLNPNHAFRKKNFKHITGLQKCIYTPLKTATKLFLQPETVNIYVRKIDICVDELIRNTTKLDSLFLYICINYHAFYKVAANYIYIYQKML